MKAFLVKHWKRLAPLLAAAAVGGAGVYCQTQGVPGSACSVVAEKVISVIAPIVGQ